jgi:hypothetical protein
MREKREAMCRCVGRSASAHAQALAESAEPARKFRRDVVSVAFSSAKISKERGGRVWW